MVRLAAGDHVYNLLWRLEHGGHVMHNAHPKVIVVQIGTNDLTCARFPPGQHSEKEHLRKSAADIVKR